MAGLRAVGGSRLGAIRADGRNTGVFERDPAFEAVAAASPSIAGSDGLTRRNR